MKESFFGHAFYAMELAAILGFIVYKLACLAVGTFLAWLGYRLFALGISGNAGQLDARLKDIRLALKSAAPGTFFAVLGAAIVLGTVWRGMDISADLARLERRGAELPPPLPKPNGGGTS